MNIGYIASYANREIDDLKHILDNIQIFANQLIKKIEPVYQKCLFLINERDGYHSPINYETFALPLVKKTYSDNHDCFEGMIDKSEIDNRNQIDKLLAAEIAKDEFKYHEILYTHYPYYKNNLIEWIYLRIATGLKFEELHPFVLNSLEHRNYLKLKYLSEPLFNNQATYLKYKSEAMMDLNIEVIGEQEIAMSHYYEQNGDMMADPDVTFKIDNQNELAIATSYSQDNLNYYICMNNEPKMMHDVNEFVEDWLCNIENSGYTLEEIHGEDEIYNIHKEKADFIKFLSKNEMKAFYTNLKEKRYVKNE